MAIDLQTIVNEELSDDDFNRLVEQIRNVVVGITEFRKITKREMSATMHNFQRICYSREEDTYDEVESFIKQCNQQYEEKIRNSTDVFGEYINICENYKKIKVQLIRLFNYMDRNFVDMSNMDSPKIPIEIGRPNSNKTLTVSELLTYYGKTTALNLKDVFAERFLSYVESLRNASTNVEFPEIQKVIQIFDELEEGNVVKNDKCQNVELYKKIIEQPIIKRVEEYCGTKSLEDFQSMSFPDYLLMCDDTLKREEKLMKEHFPRSMALVTQTVWNKLVYDHLKLIVERTMNCIKCQEFENVKIAYTSLKYSTDAMKEINAELEAREETIFSKFREISDAVTFCESFLTTFNEEQDLLKLCFDSNRGSLAALDKGISKALNMSKEDKEAIPKSSDVSRVPDFLVEYLDKLMRAGIRGLDEKETEKKVDGAITIFQYIEDKDVFIQLYAKRLSKRLIHSTSQSKEAEEMMVNRMKMICGNQFVAKVEKMITDVELSKDITSKFNEINTLPVTFSILVTQTGSWPIPAFKSAIIVPIELCDLLTSFNKYYSETHTGRKLQWHHVLSTCDIKLNYLSRSCTVQTTVTITAILVQFNSVDSVTFEELKISTGIDKKNLLKLLQYLATQNILSNDGDKVTEESTFGLNYKYESKRSRIKLIPVLREATEETNEATKAAVEERKFYLQALIVRIMKSKKTLSHKDLANEVIQESISSFVPSQVFIKSVIDGLIHKEYLARAEGEGDVYNYLA